MATAKQNLNLDHELTNHTFMKNYALLFSLALTLGFTSCKNENKDKETDETMTTDATEVQEEAPVSKKLTISLDSKSGSTATGNVVFTEEDGEVSMTAVFEGLEPGMHAIHIHENADCSADDGTSA